MKPYINLVKCGLGGVQGNGKQMFSWVHISDLFRAIIFILENENLHGVFNCSAPTPVTNNVFMKEMRNIIKPLIALPSPKPLLKMGAVLLGTESELVLKSRWVIPLRLEKSGFVFQYDNIKAALNHILI